jgi:hypothetical protein
VLGDCDVIVLCCCLVWISKEDDVVFVRRGQENACRGLCWIADEDVLL